MTPKEIADAILREQGEWMIGQLGDQGLHDCIWDTFPEFATMTEHERAHLFLSVREELFG